MPIIQPPTATAIVTGGAGFIGSHLVDDLVTSGFDVVVVDNLSTGRPANVHVDARLIEADVVDAEAMRTIAHRFPGATWYHLAAQVDVRHSVASPIDDAWVNVLGTLSVLEAARTTGGRVVFASTGGAMYGAGVPRPTPETARVLPLSPYGASKRAAEGYLQTFAELHGVPTVALRFANVYGPRQDPHGEAGVVAIFVGKLLDGDPVTIYANGSQRRDYVWVGDVVEALTAAGARLADEPARLQGRCFNVGTGRETSVLDLWHAVQRAAGRRGQHVFAPARAGELAASCLDPTRLRAQLGATCATDIDAGLRLTWEWFRLSSGVASRPIQSTA